MSVTANHSTSGTTLEAAPVSPPRLERVLGLWEVTAGGIGIIIGAGVYVLIGAATAQAGAAVWLAFVLAAVLSALTGLSYAELVSMFPRASAEYEYTRHAFPAWLAFLMGWLMIAGFVIAAAAIALGFVHYVEFFLPAGPRLGAFALIVLVTGIALTGIKQSARVTIALSAVQVGGVMLVIAIGVQHIGDVDLPAGTSAGGVLGAAALVFFPFLGFDDVNTLAEETRDPTRTVPRALLLALGVSTALYVLVAIAAVSVLGTGFLEEWGWTEFATPRLLGRYPWLVAGIVLGVPWAVWHLLADYRGSINAYGEWYVPHFMLWIVALTAFRTLMVRAYMGTRSLLLAQLTHASCTGSQAALGPVEVLAGAAIACYAALTAVLCAAVLVMTLAGGVCWIMHTSQRPTGRSFCHLHRTASPRDPLTSS